MNRENSSVKPAGRNVVQTSTRSEKEKFWHEKIAHQKTTGLSQAALCRREGPSENAFSSWKRVLAERDREQKIDRAALRKAAREAQREVEALSVEPSAESATENLPASKSICPRSD